MCQRINTDTVVSALKVPGGLVGETFWLRPDSLVGPLPAETGLFTGTVCGAKASTRTGGPTAFFRLHSPEALS